MNANVTSKSVVITGAGSGIGRASALAFAAQGDAVVVSDINADKAAETVAIISKAGGQAAAHQADVTDADQIDALVNFACEHYGRLDVMFSNAGGATPTPLHTQTPEQYHSIMALNLHSVFYGSMAALKVMRKQGSGCILATTSGAGLAAVPGLAIYGSAKAGIINLMRSIAVEYGSDGIRANAIAPGAMDTPGLQSWLQTLAGGAAAYEQQIPSSRLGTADEIASAAVFLASDLAAYINGSVLPVDGGTHAKLASPRP